MSEKQYIELPSINGQKIRKKYYCASAVKHPAKADIPLMIWILKKFCKDDETVLDPMAGIFTTGVEGIRLFPNSLFIGIELEHKFVKWANASIKKTERIAKEDWFMKVGKAVCIQGDARQLEKVLKEKVSKIISSPPYASTKKGISSEKRALRMAQKMEESSPKYGKRTTPGRLKHLKKEADGYSQNSNNIGNLDYGKADKIISSPPFGGQVQHKTNYLGKQKRESGFEYSEDPENIGNKPHGSLDAIIGKRILDSKGRIRIEKICLNCDIKFPVFPCRKISAKYCSNKCKWLSYKHQHHSPETEFSRENYPKISDEQYQFILGTLLGDGSLDSKSKTSRLQITHADSQKEYFNWKIKILGNLIESSPSHHKIGSFSISTITHPIFNKLREMLYLPQKKKKITEQFLNYLDFFSLAVWFMDDGSCDKGMSITLATCSFGLKENEIIKNWFKKKWNIECRIKMKNKKYPVLYFPKKSAFHLSQLLLPFVPNFMRYKFAIPNSYHQKPIQNSIVDKIITLPPFGQAQSGGGIAKKGYTGDKHSPTDLVGKRSYMPENVGEDKKNISNLPYTDKIISSPPYQESISKSTSRMCREELNRKLWHSDYGDNKQNIGNLKQQTYLQAMKIVYQQCHQILKSQGLMILITKDFIRNKKRVRLGEDTIRLCQMAGFKHIKTYHREIKNPSFWRILYEQKHPSADKIDCEDILCFKKKDPKCPRTNS